MNEKAKELILKAGFKNAYFDPKDGFEVVFVDEEHTTESLDKLIKLVTKECMLIVGDGTVDGEIYHDRIKRHFGA
jgi:hypothetical protein